MLPKRRPATPDDWGIKVTVCIGAMAYYGTSLIITTDQMISTIDARADEVALKILGIHHNWAAMYAGSVTHVAPILRTVRQELSGKDASYDEVERAVVKAYRERLETEETNTVLGRYGLTMERFLTDGLQRFGPSEFSRILQKTEQISLGASGLEFLVAGYDAKGNPHIFSVTDPGRVENHNVTGFWAIGSGQNAALASLFFHSYNRRMPLQEALYHVCAAKFMAEKASDVGETTSVLILSASVNDSSGALRMDVSEFQSVEAVKKIWKSEGRPRIPRNLHARMQEILSVQGATQFASLGPPSS
jgi:ATP-dependent protease HslVU (ClpYQ) peptidase subunit